MKHACTVAPTMAQARPGQRESVVVANPGRQYSYETALAAQEVGLLRAFATGVYLGGDHLPARAVRAAMRLPRGPRALRGATNRIDARLDPERVVSYPLLPILARAARRLSWGHEAERWALRRCDARIACWLTRQAQPPAIVNGFELGALATFRAAKELGATTVLDVPAAHEYAAAAQGEDPREDPHTPRVLAERELADYLVAPSGFVLDCLADNGVPEERLVKIPYGTEPPAEVAPRDSGDIFRALFVGTIGRRKGVDVLLEAWRKLALPRSELVVVGGATPSNAALLQNRPTSCRWVGIVTRRELPDLFGQCDVFVFPTRAEGSALVTYQAMGEGRVVVTTPAAGSVITDGADGLIIPVDDPDALAEQLLRLYEQPELRRELGARARETILARYTWAHYRTRVRALYVAILEGCDPALAAREAVQ
jgi:glycosyltransferase involved in cell wall biosynthesis